MRIGKQTALGLICALAVAFAAAPAQADVVMDQTFGMVYLVFANGAFDSYSGMGGGETYPPPGFEGYIEEPSFQTYTVIAYAQQIGGTYPSGLQFNVTQNLPSAVSMGNEYFYFGSLMGSEHLGISAPSGHAAPIPDVPGPPSWEQAILGGLKNMNYLNTGLGALGGSATVTSDELWGFLAAMQPPPEMEPGPGLIAYDPYFGFSDVDFADIVNYRANGGENEGFIQFDPISELFSTNEDAFSGFTDPTGAGLFIMNAVPVNSVILNPPGSPGGYIPQNQLVPEPATLSLLLAAAGFACVRRRRNAA
jgi:hypothetical protein